MAFEIKTIDKFINECKESGKEITYDNFAPINESLNSDIQVPLEIFEAYLKYVDISGTDMVSILEFEKIKSFSEFIADKKEGDDSISKDDTDDQDDTTSDDSSSEEPKDDDTTSDDSSSDNQGSTDDSKDDNSSDNSEDDDDNDDNEDKDKKDDDMSIKVESVQTPPEKVSLLPGESKDDESQQTKVDLATGDGDKTSDAIEDTINKLGEPKKESDAEGAKLIGENGVQTPPEKVSAQSSENKDDASQQTKVDLATGDGSKTAEKIEDTINKLGEPKKESDAEGAKLIGESDQEKKTLK